MTYLIIGSGRTAYHMTHYLTRLGHEVKGWHYQTTNSSLLNNLPHDPKTLFELSMEAERILLLIKDGAIEDFLLRYPFLKTKKTVHFSGALRVDGISNVHPLVSFGTCLFADSFYENIPFANFEEETGWALPGVPNPFFKVSMEEKAHYHALCVASGNLMVLLWQLAGAEFQKCFQIPTTLLHPYLQSLTTNLLSHWDSALTGPIARRDESTLNKNYVTLQNTPLQKIFEAHVEMAWPEFAKKYFKKNQDLDLSARSSLPKTSPSERMPQ